MIPPSRVVRSVAVCAAAALAIGVTPAAAAAVEAPAGRLASPGSGVYVVTLTRPPAASYDGGTPGLAPTRPRGGARFDSTRPEVRAYTARLLREQDRVLDRVGRPPVLYRYTTALNGFAAALSGDQLRRLREVPAVSLVERSTKQHVDRAPAVATVAGGRHGLRGLHGPNGAWARVGGPARAGDGVVVGVVDTGIWPENPSFNGLPQRTPGTAARLPGFHGACAPAAEWSPDDCNDKVVSARWFVKGFGPENVAGLEYLSARDGSGHGSHVASVAAGNDAVRVSVDGHPMGSISGVAPAARLAVYKACWAAPDPSRDGCTTADSLAAVDRAVADGVDVLNYSVSDRSSTQGGGSAMERALLGAATAGVFVTTSAGNTGPRAATVTHVSPWVTTVGASTQRAFQGGIRLGNGRSYVGAELSDRPVGPARLALAVDLAAPGVDAASARRCLPGSLAAAAAEGRIVVCDRGGGPRVGKSATVATAGGVGMVLANVRPRSTEADAHAVPSVHLDLDAATAVKRYVRRNGERAVASLDPRAGTAAGVPAVADFSGRGPARSAGGDLLKPDVVAPGVSILGAVAPPTDADRLWDVASGTSTSAPHVAGLAALLLGWHRSWPPSRVKSALMTTAGDLTGRHGPLTQGAGLVDPRRALDPGLVFDTPAVAWQRLAAGRLDPRRLNTPSVALGDLVGPTTVTRVVTNAGRRIEAYSVRKVALADVDVQAFPATVLLRPGESAAVRLRVTARPSATVDREVTGWLVWTGARHRVRIPVSVRPTVVAAPRQVAAPPSRRSVVVRGRSGNGRTVKLHATGLVPARTTPVRLAPGRFDPAKPAADADTVERQVRIPPATDVARFATSPDETRDDVDLYVYRDGRLVGSDTGASPAPEVTLTEPAPGDYMVYVNARSTDDGAAGGELYTWVVPEEGGAEVQLSTDAVGFAAGKRFRYSASWDDLDPDKQYLGVVGYGDSDRRTLVEVR